MSYVRTLLARTRPSLTPPRRPRPPAAQPPCPEELENPSHFLNDTCNPCPCRSWGKCKWGECNQCGDATNLSLTPQVKGFKSPQAVVRDHIDSHPFFDSRVKEWCTVIATGVPLRFLFHQRLSSLLTRTVSSLTWLSLILFSTNGGQMSLFYTGPGTLCALASVFASLVCIRHRRLLEAIMHDKVRLLRFDFAPLQSR